MKEAWQQLYFDAKDRVREREEERNYWKSLYEKEKARKKAAEDVIKISMKKGYINQKTAYYEKWQKLKNKK